MRPRHVVAPDYRIIQLSQALTVGGEPRRLGFSQRGAIGRSRTWPVRPTFGW